LRSYEGRGTYEIKVDSALDGAQQFGLLFEHDPMNFMVFMLYAYPNDVVKAYIERFAYVGGQLRKTTFSAGTIGITVPDPGPYYLRVTVNDATDPAQREWQCEWSVDGAGWTKLFSGVYEGAGPEENIGSIASVGLFAGNQPPSFDGLAARFDYFRFSEMVSVSGLAARGGDQKVDLWWDGALIADQYAIYASASQQEPFSLVGTTESTSFSHVGLTNDNQYNYMVAPFKDTLQGPVSAIVSAIPHTTGVSSGLPGEGLILALNAEDLSDVYNQGDPVTQWQSAGGEPIAATSTVGIAPIFQTSAIDVRPAVRFDGVDDYLTMPAGFQDFTGGMLLFVVMRPTVLQQGFKIVALGNGPGQQDIVLGRAGSTSGFQYFTNDSNGGWGWFDTSGGLAVGEATVVSVMQQAGAANSSRQADLAVNGVSLQSGNVYVPPVTTRGLNYIGKSYCNEGMFQGDVAEIILYNRTLSAEEKAVVEDHLSQKYVLSLP